MQAWPQPSRPVSLRSLCSGRTRQAHSHPDRPTDLHLDNCGGLCPFATHLLTNYLYSGHQQPLRLRCKPPPTNALNSLSCFIFSLHPTCVSCLLMCVCRSVPHSNVKEGIWGTCVHCDCLLQPLATLVSASICITLGRKEGRERRNTEMSTYSAAGFL